MSNLDWGVMIGATLFIIVYGIWKSRGTRTMRAYLLSDKGLKWWMVGLSIMATQASAITFLSTPGQAFDDGMRFVQFYFGVPVAMVLISMFAIPIYHKLNVYTAYEYLEGRFDLKTRALATWLFLLSRGLSTGLTLYAPAIIFSSLLGWDIRITCIATGLLVMAYIVSGGNEAVNQTQKQQLLIALAGMVIAGVVMVQRLPADISLGDAVYIGGKMGKLNAFTLPDWTNFDWKDRYNLFSGLIGGTFLALSYFGTDQSQVQRYLGGRSLAESRIGLIFNGMLKAPMQFGILFLGVIMFVFFQFEDRPLFFQEKEVIRVYSSPEGEAYRQLEQQNEQLQTQKQSEIRLMLDAREKGDRAGEEQRQQSLTELEQESRRIRKEAQ
ncbi:MAG: sodium:solute symporter, partial [Bacteroidetes bacterium]